MINRVVLSGRLTRDPEMKTTPNGIQVCTFSLAVDRGFGEKKETDFVPIVTWRGLAENCGKYLTKGKQAVLEGRLQIRTYEDREGKKE